MVGLLRGEGDLFLILLFPVPIILDADNKGYTEWIHILRQKMSANRKHGYFSKLSKNYIKGLLKLYSFIHNDIYSSLEKKAVSF